MTKEQEDYFELVKKYHALQLENKDLRKELDRLKGQATTDSQENSQTVWYDAK